MTKMTKLVLVMTLAVATALAVTGCDGDQAPTAPPPPQPTAADAALPADLFLDKAPDGAQELAAAKKSAKAGDEIVLRGRVGGQEEPIAPNRAILTLLDSAIKTCNQMAGDTCKTPWDACCEPGEVLRANTATIQIVDADGRPLKTGLRGVHGIEPMKEVVIVGEVKGQEADTLVVDATGIYVKG